MDTVGGFGAIKTAVWFICSLTCGAIALVLYWAVKNWRLSRPVSRSVLDLWLIETVRYYQTLGFFSDLLNAPDKELFDLLKKRSETEDLPFPNNNKARSDETFLLVLDTSRMWWTDLETDVCLRSEKTYTESLSRLSALSRGALIITDVEEFWDCDEERYSVDGEEMTQVKNVRDIKVAFKLNGEPQEMHLKYTDDWLDTDFFEQFDKMIRPLGYALMTFDCGGQDIAVAIFTTEESDRWQADRKGR